MGLIAMATQLPFYLESRDDQRWLSNVRFLRSTQRSSQLEPPLQLSPKPEQVAQISCLDSAWYGIFTLARPGNHHLGNLSEKKDDDGMF